MNKQNKRLLATVLTTLSCSMLEGTGKINAGWYVFGSSSKYLKSFIKSDRESEQDLIKAILDGSSYSDTKIFFDKCYNESAYKSYYSSVYKMYNGDPASIIAYARRNDVQKGLLKKLALAYEMKIKDYCREWCNKNSNISSTSIDMKQIDKDMKRLDSTLDTDIQEFCGLKMKYLLANNYNLRYTQGMIQIVTLLIQLSYIDPITYTNWSDLCSKLNLWTEKVENGINDEITMVQSNFNLDQLIKIMRKLSELLSSHRDQQQTVKATLESCSDEPNMLATTILQRGVLDWTSIPELRVRGSKLFNSIKSKEDVDKFYEIMFNELVSLSKK